MDTVPLLTPTMETELLKDPWTFPQSKMNQIKEEEKTASSIWEENFQDLSGWCMETFQARYDFPAGESPVFKLSGTKYEGNSALSSEEGVLKDLIGVADEERWNVKMDSAETTNYFTSNCHSLQTTPKVTTSKCAEEDSTADTTTSSNWLKLPRGATASSTSTSPWNKQNTTTVSTPSFQPEHQAEDIDLDDACPTSIDSEKEPGTWDVLRTVETTGADTFDLLSYLCDDEMRSPEGSVSTDSSVVSKPWSTADSSQSIPQSYGRGEAENTKPVVEECTSSRAASTATSSSAETIIVSSRKSERLRSSAEKTYHKVEKSYNRIARREKPAKRRCTDATEDRPFTVHYRESREKNNEASRKSRMNKKAKECEMSTKAIELERDNRILKMKVEELEKLVTSMRSALLRSAMKKEF
ncbi:uncharacterized protein LOC143354468 isoform X1 [Halictus rubicundus]|uniref:uncharacterized protein LOC143354468 isoform X1 n=2 Tax=Halictus rubicundus TaxID=77578 RepID=UPI0040357E1D